MKSSNIRYLPGLDHLRAFAALLVVFYHVLLNLSLLPGAAPKDTAPLWFLPRKPFAVLLQEGHTAVALFMVLSGFVFSIGSIGREVQYWPFMRNRFLRIYPLLLLLAFVGAAASPSTYTLRGMLQTLLFQGNFEGALNCPPFTNMFWAISVEFQFYWAFPFLHRFLERDGWKFGLGLIALAIMLRTFATMCGTSNAGAISYWHIIGRIDQFVIGMMAAQLFERIRERRLPWTLLAFLSFTLALAALMGFSVLGGGETIALWKVLWPPVEGLSWACFVVSYIGFAQCHAGSWSRPLERLGTWSYSIYLLHWVVIMAMRRLVPLEVTATPNYTAQIYGLTVVLPVLLPVAALSYYVVERPFLQMRVKYLQGA